MLKYLRWMFWCAYYAALPPKHEVLAMLPMYERTRVPWWKFKPTCWHNDAGRQWHVTLSEERGVTVATTIRVRATISDDTGKVVGLTIYDESLKELTRKDTP